MKAVTISEFNTKPSLQEIDAPEPGEGELVVNVVAASVNGMDIMSVNGMMANVIPCEFPITLGRDFAGTVASLGEGVNGLAVGDLVYGLALPMTKLHVGTFAERTVVPAFTVAKRPESVDATVAGALGLAGAAAKIAIENAAPEPSETILIGGATGGVGSIAIQLAKSRGALVIATARSDESEFVKELGADEVVDYTEDLGTGMRNLGIDRADAAIHLAGDPMSLARLVRRGGRLVSTLGVGPDQVAEFEIDAKPVMTIPSPELLDGLVSAVAQGELRVPVTRTYGLDEVGQALDHFSSGALGKIGIRIA